MSVPMVHGGPALSPAYERKGATPSRAARPTRSLTLTANRRGFMLIEAALATIIIGLAVVSLLGVIGASTRSGGQSRDLTRATFLAQEIRELLAPLPMCEEDGVFGPEAGEALASYDDIDDFDDLALSPPINAQRETLTDPDWADWRQSITVDNVDPSYFAGHQILQGGATDIVRVTVIIHKGGRLVHQMSWLAAAPTPEEE